MKIRRECPSDYSGVYALVKASFAASLHSDGTEADYLNEVRKKETFIPELSFVAENEDDELIGQIVLYKTNIITADQAITELVLSPLCVRPDHFRRGVARALMERSFEVAEGLGYRLVFLCGDPQFYRKIGFAPTYEHGIYHVTDAEKNAEWCMVRELVSGTLKEITGAIDIE